MNHHNIIACAYANSFTDIEADNDEQERKSSITGKWAVSTITFDEKCVSKVGAQFPPHIDKD